MFASDLMGWTQEKESKRRESEPEESCSIVGKHVLQQPDLMNLQSIWVHCVFSFKKKKVH